MSKGKTIEEDILTDLEEKIYDSIKNTQNKHVVFQINSNLIEECCQKLKTSELKVYKALYSLLQRKFIVPGSALSRDDILSNGNRMAILKVIQQNPGTHIRELCNLLGKSSGVVRAHLKVLDAFEYIRKKSYTNPRLTLLFSKDYPDSYDDFFVVMKNENDIRLLQLLINKLLTVSELSEQMGVHHSTVQYHLEKLGRLNLVIRSDLDENTTKYSFNITKLDTFMTFLDEMAT